jgi:hypothetical protein
MFWTLRSRYLVNMFWTEPSCKGEANGGLRET